MKTPGPGKSRWSGRVLSGGCAVGHLAKQMLGRTPESITVVRPLSDGVIADFELCEAMLRYFLRKAQRPGVRLKPRVLVAVPGCITPVEKRAALEKDLDEYEKKVLMLMLDGVRDTESYAQELGVDHLDSSTQQKAAKRAKDRLVKKLRRFGQRIKKTG